MIDCHRNAFLAVSAARADPLPGPFPSIPITPRHGPGLSCCRVSACAARMERSAQERAAWRRQNRDVGILRSDTDAKTLGRSFWHGASATLRFDAVVQMAIESETVCGRDPPARLQRSLGGVRSL